MSKFNSYAKKLDEQAREAFRAYREAEKAYKDAEKKAKEYPPQRGADPDYTVKSTRAQADLVEAKEAYSQATRAFKNSTKQFDGMRKDLAADLNDAYSVDPTALDSATLELLKSGIMTGSEYEKLLNQAKAANNPTMARMIGKYAGDAAEARSNTHGENDSEAIAMKIIADDSRKFTGGDRLEAFDNMISLYRRCTNNPAMIDYWGEFTADTVENF